jgi:hypothetical protein
MAVRRLILHMLMRTTSNQVWAAWHDEQPYDRDRHVAELRALPGSRERERAAMTAGAAHEDARKKARRHVRAARRRNRRPKQPAAAASRGVGSRTSCVA